METMVDGIFTCGNCLHVHDVVDFVTDEGRLAGHGAALYLRKELPSGSLINVKPGEGIGYVVPQTIDSEMKENVTFKFRVRKPVKDVWLIIESNGQQVAKIMKPVLIPSEMVMVKLSKDKLDLIKDEVTLRLEAR
jgi:hypothetical protein